MRAPVPPGYGMNCDAGGSLLPRGMGGGCCGCGVAAVARLCPNAMPAPKVVAAAATSEVKTNLRRSTHVSVSSLSATSSSSCCTASSNSSEDGEDIYGAAPGMFCAEWRDNDGTDSGTVPSMGEIGI